LLPPGTLTARPGLPATILTRGLLTFTFFGADAYVTLAVTAIRHRSPAFAGIAVTGATVSWTTGAWVQARLNDKWEGRRMVRTGRGTARAGSGGVARALRRAIPAGAALAAWTVAGLGMGLAYAPISLMMLRKAPPGQEGRSSASLNLADVLGTAIGIGVGGAAGAAGAGSPPGLGLPGAVAAAAAAGGGGPAGSPRPPGTIGSASPPVTDRVPAPAPGEAPR